MIKIKRALISVSDKTGLEELVRELHKYKVEIVSTGGTAEFIKKLGVPVVKVSDLTGAPEMLSGRVKTLHPKIHGGLLALRQNAEHMEEVKKHGIGLIDMVVVNLYPFAETIARPGVSQEEAIENIDIGGPSMLRSAAKNHKSVAVLSDSRHYPKVISQLRENDGALSAELCAFLAAEVFEKTSAYDQAIADYLKIKSHDREKSGVLPQSLHGFEKIQDLRYGENPHQSAALYGRKNSRGVSVVNAQQLQGKELSFNNILDLDAALNIVQEFSAPAAVIVKHSNPCGAAQAKDLKTAYEYAFSGDPLSAFGGIVGLNQEVDEAAALAITGSGFVECVIAPGFSAEACKIFSAKKNVRLMSVKDFSEKCSAELDLKKINNGLLAQTKDDLLLEESRLQVVTKRKPNPEEMESLLFAWKIVKHVKSNAIVLAKSGKTVGIGAGQMSRVDSVMIAVKKSQGACAGAVLASDAFFPKEDSIEEAAQAGITAIIQPGGSIKDQDIIQKADEKNIAMVLTGIRHFKH